MTLDSPGVVQLDTLVVPDMLGLRARYDDAAMIRVLPGRAKNSVRELVSDARAAPQGFHDEPWWISQTKPVRPYRCRR